MTAALEVGEWSAARPGRNLPPGKTRYPFYRRPGGPQGRSGRAENLVPTGIRSRTIQPVVSRLTGWATRPTYMCVCVCIYIYIYTHTYIRIHTHTHTHQLLKGYWAELWTAGEGSSVEWLSSYRQISGWINFSRKIGLNNYQLLKKTPCCTIKTSGSETWLNYCHLFK